MEDTQERPSETNREGSKESVDFLAHFIKATGRPPTQDDVSALSGTVSSYTGEKDDFLGAMRVMAECNNLNNRQILNAIDHYAKKERREKKRSEAERREKDEKKKAFRKNVSRLAKWFLGGVLVSSVVGTGIGLGTAFYYAGYEPSVRTRRDMLEKDYSMKQEELAKIREEVNQRFFGKLESLANAVQTTFSPDEREMYVDAKMSAGHGFNSVIYEGRIFYDGKAGDVRVVGKIVNSIIKVKEDRQPETTKVYPRLVIFKYGQDGGIISAYMYDKISDSSSIDKALEEAKPELSMAFEGGSSTFYNNYTGETVKRDGKGVFVGTGDAAKRAGDNLAIVLKEFKTLHSRGLGTVQQVAPEASLNK
jgi:hypothetical protein